MTYVRAVVNKHPELGLMICDTLGVRDLQGNFTVGDHNYQLISDWTRAIKQAKNFEIAKRHEDAAKIYESLGLWKQAGRARDGTSTSTVKHITVNLNDLIDKLKTGGLSIPYRCSGCGATITLDKNTRPEALKFCSYCGSAMNTEVLADILRDALR